MQPHSHYCTYLHPYIDRIEESKIKFAQTNRLAQTWTGKAG